MENGKRLALGRVLRNLPAMNRTPVAVVGASGYSGIELLRILLQHPGFDLMNVTSRQFAGRPVADVFPQFGGCAAAESLVFTTPEVGALIAGEAEIVFLALPHGVAAGYALPLVEAGKRVVDLSADFRLRDAAVYEEFYGAPHPSPEWLAQAVYGLPEVRPDEISKAQLVASPGCYPTSVLLPLLPLLRNGLLDTGSLVIHSMSGTSGAGRKESLPLLFAECNESVRAYSVPKHRHLSEIEQELSLAADTAVRVTFVPHLIPVTAGIHTSTVAQLALGIGSGEVTRALGEAYHGKPFVRLLGEGGCPDTRHVVGGNFIDIGWSVDSRTNRLVLLSAEDNLWKGAAGQAVQSANLMNGQPEGTGLLAW